MLARSTVGATMPNACALAAKRVMRFVPPWARGGNGGWMEAEAALLTAPGALCTSADHLLP